MRPTRSSFGRSLALVVLPFLLLATAAVPVAADDPPFRARHYDLRELPWTDLSFTGWHDLALPPKPPIDEDGIPLVRKGGVVSYAVGELSMNGMRRLVRWLVRCERPQLDQALAQADKLRDLAVRRDRAWWIPHGFDYSPFGMRAPWFNAMTQGVALSFFVRLHRVTGDAHYLEDAGKVFRSFQRLGQGRDRWVAYVDDERYLWLEHYPNARPEHILNAHMHAIFGLYEYWAATGSGEARELLEGAITTVDDHLRNFRNPGGPSYYGLVSRSTIPKYHHIHVWQVQLLADITGKARFERMADHLRADLPGRRTWRGTPGYPPLPDVEPCALDSADPVDGVLDPAGDVALPGPGTASPLAVPELVPKGWPEAVGLASPSPRPAASLVPVPSPSPAATVPSPGS